MVILIEILQIKQTGTDLQNELDFPIGYRQKMLIVEWCSSLGLRLERLQ